MMIMLDINLADQASFSWRLGRGVCSYLFSPADEIIGDKNYLSQQRGLQMYYFGILVCAWEGKRF